MTIDRHTLRNAILDVIGEGIWGLQAGMVPAVTVLTVLLTRYNAGNTMIGLVSAIQGGLIYLPQILGLYIFASVKHRQRDMILWHVIGILPCQALCGILVLFEGSLDPFWLRWGLLALFSLFSINIGIIVGVWSEWLAHMFSTNIRATVMGTGFSLYSLLGAGGGLVAGWWLEKSPGYLTYSWLFLLSSAIGVFSMLAFTFIDDPAVRLPYASEKPTLRDIIIRFRASLADWNFRVFLVGRVLVSIGLCVSPFLAVFYQSPEGGRVPDSFIVMCGAAMTVGTAITTVVIGRWGDKTGHRAPIIAGAIIQALALAILLVSSGRASCVAAYLGVGVCIGFGFISHTNMLYETCPHDDRLAHITVGNIVMTIPLLVAPVIAGFFANRCGIRPLFAISLLISAVAAVWFIVFFREPRRMGSGRGGTARTGSQETTGRSTLPG